MPVVVMYSLPLLGGIVCGTVLQIAQRAAGVGVATRITCDVALMLVGARAFIRDKSRDGFMFGGLLMVTGAVAMTEGALLTTLLALKDMAFPAT